MVFRKLKRKGGGAFWMTGAIWNALMDLLEHDRARSSYGETPTPHGRFLKSSPSGSAPTERVTAWLVVEQEDGSFLSELHDVVIDDEEED